MLPYGLPHDDSLSIQSWTHTSDYIAGIMCLHVLHLLVGESLFSGGRVSRFSCFPALLLSASSAVLLVCQSPSVLVCLLATLPG